MTTTQNPYQPPTASVEDLAKSSLGRPAWVWVICIFLSIGILGAMASMYMIASGMIPVEGAAARYFESLGALDYAIVVGGVMLQVALVVTLFRLQRVALPIAVTSFVIGILTLLFNVATNPHYADMAAQNGYGSMAIGWAINIAVLFYVYRLRERGVLR